MKTTTEKPKAEDDCSPATCSAIFEYRGKMYMRPVYRGAVLSDLPDEPQFDNDVLPAGDYYVEILVYPSQNVKGDSQSPNQ